MGLQAMVVKLLGMYGEEKMTRVHARQGGDDRTALDYAAYRGHMDIVKLLVPIPFPTPTGRGLLAAQETRTQYLSLALIDAIVAQKSEISQYLISEGADVNFGPTGTNLLVRAVGTENVGLVELVLASCADQNLSLPILFIAVCTPNMDIVRALVDGGADIHVQHNRHNILWYCANIELLRFFLERGVDPNAEDDAGWTALHRACRKTFTEDAIAVAEYVKGSVELLLQFGAGPVDKANDNRDTAVDLAMYAGHSETVKILEPLVQDPNMQTRIAAWWEARRGEGLA